MPVGGGGGGRGFDVDEGIAQTERYNLDRDMARYKKMTPREKKQQDVDMESCQRTPRYAPGDGITAWFWSWVETIIRAFDLTMLVFFMLYLMDNWAIKTTELRWYTGSVAVVWGLWWVFAGLGGAVQYFNESQMASQKEEDRNLMRCNIPPMRYGFMYLSFFATGFFVLFGYLHQQLLDFGTDLITEGDRRAFNAKIWMFSGLLLLDLIYNLCDYFIVMHARIDAARGKQACKDLHDRSEHKDHPGMPLAEFAVDVLDKANTMLAFTAVLFIGQELSTGGNTAIGGSARDWAPSTWLFFNGIVACLMAGVGVIMFATMIIMRDHHCLWKSLSHGTLYWMGFASWLFAVWYRMFVFIHDKARDGLATESNRKDWETLMWVSLIAYSAQLLLIYFHDFRCQVRYAFSKINMLMHCYSM